MWCRRRGGIGDLAAGAADREPPPAAGRTSPAAAVSITAIRVLGVAAASSTVAKTADKTAPYPIWPQPNMTFSVHHRCNHGYTVQEVPAS
jgi:hypothetical protein